MNITEFKHVKPNKDLGITEAKEIPVAHKLNCFRRPVENFMIRL